MTSLSCTEKSGNDWRGRLPRREAALMTSITGYSKQKLPGFERNTPWIPYSNCLLEMLR